MKIGKSKVIRLQLEQIQRDAQLLNFLGEQSTQLVNMELPRYEKEFSIRLVNTLKTIQGRVRNRSVRKTNETIRKLSIIEQAQIIFSSFDLFLLSQLLERLPYQQRKQTVFTYATAFILYWIILETISLDDLAAENSYRFAHEKLAEVIPQVYIDFTILPEKRIYNRFISFLELFKKQSDPILHEKLGIRFLIPSETNQQLLVKVEDALTPLPAPQIPIEPAFPELEQRLWEFIEEAARELDNTGKNSTITKPIDDMGEVVGRERVDVSPPILSSPLLEPTAPSVQLWQVIELANSRANDQGKPLLNDTQLIVLNIYLTRQVSMSELKPLAGVKTKQAVQDQLHKSMRKVFPHLPNEIKAEYETPENALRVRTGKHTEQSLRRMKQGLDRLGRPDQDKIEFSVTHRQHLTEANLRRWEQYRTEGKQQGALPFSEQGLENIKQGRRKTSRETKPHSKKL